MNEPFDILFAANHWAYATDNHVSHHVPNIVRDVALLPTGERALSDETKARIDAGAQAWGSRLEEARDSRARTYAPLDMFIHRLGGTLPAPVRMPRHRPSPVCSNGYMWAYDIDDTVEEDERGMLWMSPELPRDYLYSQARPRSTGNWPANWDEELAGGKH